MSRFFHNSARATAFGPLTWRTWVGLIVVPVLVAAGLTWAFWSPLDNHGSAKAAVVNQDEPVTINGRLIPLGRELAGDLVHSETSSYDWTLTDADDAKEGISDGTYAAVVTIPKNFSAQATSTAGKEPLKATQATMHLETSQRTGLVDPVATKEVASATLAALNKQVVETYLDNIYVGFSSISKQLNQAADGAGQLADGTGQLKTGADQLANGSKQLVVGLRQLTDGTSKLASGAGDLAGGAGQLSSAATQLSTGASQLASGTAQLSTGSKQLSTGLTQAEKDTADLPKLTKQLADGAQQVADGNKQLADKIVPLADLVIKAIDALPSATESAQRFADLAARCDQDEQFCADLRKAADKFTADAKVLDGKRAEIRAAAVQTKTSIQDLSAGAQKVADGNKQLAEKSKDLAGGISDAAAGARKLNTGIQQANIGAQRLATGTGQLSGGATSLANGSTQLATGAKTVADGAQQASTGAQDLATGTGKLADGAGKTDTGAQELAKGLNNGRGQVPDYSQADRDHLKQVAATPVITDTSGSSPPFGNALAALILVLALWACALATYLVIRAVPASVLTTREASWRIILAAAIPGATIAILTAVVLSAIFVVWLGLGVGDALTLLPVLVLAAGTFTVVNQAAVAIFKRPGRFASIAVLVLTVAGGVVSSVPAFFTGILAFLPTHGAILALRSVLAGSDGLATGVLQLLVWLAIGTVAMIAVTDRRRSLPNKELRLPKFV